MISLYLGTCWRQECNSQPGTSIQIVWAGAQYLPPPPLLLFLLSNCFYQDCSYYFVLPCLSCFIVWLFGWVLGWFNGSFFFLFLSSSSSSELFSSFSSFLLLLPHLGLCLCLAFFCYSRFWRCFCDGSGACNLCEPALFVLVPSIWGPRNLDLTLESNSSIQLCLFKHSTAQHGPPLAMNKISNPNGIQELFRRECGSQKIPVISGLWILGTCVYSFLMRWMLGAGMLLLSHAKKVNI